MNGHAPGGCEATALVHWQMNGRRFERDREHQDTGNYPTAFTSHCNRYICLFLKKVRPLQGPHEKAGDQHTGETLFLLWSSTEKWGLRLTSPEGTRVWTRVGSSTAAYKQSIAPAMDLQLEPTSVTSGVGETTAKTQPVPASHEPKARLAWDRSPCTKSYWLISSWMEMPEWHSMEFRVDSSRSQFLIMRDPIAYWWSKQNDVAGFLVSQADHKIQSISQEMQWTHQLGISFQSKHEGKESENKGQYRELSFGLSADKQTVGLSQKWGILQFSSSTAIVFSILTVLPQHRKQVNMQHNFEYSTPHVLAFDAPSQCKCRQYQVQLDLLSRVCIISIVVKCC